MATYKVVKMETASVSEDGRMVSAKFNTRVGVKVVLEFRSEWMRDIITKLSGLLRIAESRSNLAIQGVLAAEQPRQTVVGTTDDGQTVILGFVMHGDIEHRFALPSSTALAFSAEIARRASQSETPAPSKPH